MIKAVVFDLGGVLVRTLDYAGRRKWEARLGLGERGADKLVFDNEVSTRATVGQADMRAIWEYVAREHALDEAALAEFERDFWAGDVLDTELVALIQGLRARYKTGLLSNAWDTLRPLLASRFAPLDQVFDLIMISCEEGLAKPDAELYRRLVARLGLAAEEVVFVDDFERNVLGARAVGLQAIQYKHNAQLLAALRALGVVAD